MCVTYVTDKMKKVECLQTSPNIEPNAWILLWTEIVSHKDAGREA